MKKTIIAVVTVAVVAVLGVTAWLLLKPEGDTTVRGTCGSGATYELQAEPEDGVVEVTFELQSSGPDETWNVRLDQDGTSLIEGERSTDEDGELDMDAIAQDEDADEFSVVAVPVVDGEEGEACTATLTR